MCSSAAAASITPFDLLRRTKGRLVFKNNTKLFTLRPFQCLLTIEEKTPSPAHDSVTPRTGSSLLCFQKQSFTHPQTAPSAQGVPAAEDQPHCSLQTPPSACFRLFKHAPVCTVQTTSHEPRSIFNTLPRGVFQRAPRPRRDLTIPGHQLCESLSAQGLFQAKLRVAMGYPNQIISCKLS